MKCDEVQRKKKVKAVDTFENNWKDCSTRKGNENWESKTVFLRYIFFWKNVIWQTIYGFYQNKVAPTWYGLSKLKDISAGTDCKFPYGRTMLHAYLVKVSSLVNEAIGEVLDFSLWKNLTHKKSIKNKTNDLHSVIFIRLKSIKALFLIKSIKSIQATFAQIFLYA